jgi:hypothetical protein
MVQNRDDPTIVFPVHIGHDGATQYAGQGECRAQCLLPTVLEPM